jgi:thiol-disulfide isomerase/thioredoxin
VAAVRRTLLLPVVTIVLTACTSVTADVDSTVVREMAAPLPALEGETLDGTPMSSDDLAGDVLVVNAWASWCLPCEREQPQLAALAEEYADRGVSFLGINHADQLAQATAFVDRYDVPYPSLHDPAGRLAASLGYLGLPDTYVVDRDGVVRWAVNGPTDRAQLTELIDDVLAADAA